MTTSRGGPMVSRAVLADQRAIVREEFGEEVDQQALALLDPADLEMLTRPDSLGWCEIGLAQRYKDAVGRRVGKSSLDFQRWVVQRSAERILKGIWRLLLTQVWDAALVKRIPLMYRRTFNTGEMLGTFEGKGVAKISVRGWPGIPEYDIVGLQVGIETILRLTGRIDAAARPTTTREGVDYAVRWSVKEQPSAVGKST